MSFVLPLAMGVVIALMYLAIYMFMYVYAYSLAEVTADSLESVVGQDSIYWQINCEYVKKEDADRITAELHKNLGDMCVLPGIGFDYEYDVGGNIFAPEVKVAITEKLYGKKLFTVSAKKTVYRPAEFADDVDVFYEIYDSLGAFKEVGALVSKLFGGA